MARYALLVDLDLCGGCQACVVGCNMENNIPISTPEIFQARRMTLRSRVVPLAEPNRYPNPGIVVHPVLCNHCDNPPCVSACPTGATFRRADGIVLMDWDRCIGCRYCMSACPYGSRVYIEQEQAPEEYHNPDLQAYYGDARPPKGKVDKCTFCSHLVDKGQTPACVTACPCAARIFGDLDDPDSRVSRLLATRKSKTLRPDFGTKPMVHYLL